MNPQQIELYQRIQAFSLDQLGGSLSFSQRLAKDNGWSWEYTQKAIEEYKKFTFLAVAAGHPVSPSDQVDQVWHLHLTYSRSYWQDFCPNVLQTPFHHEPTRGGLSEQVKLNDWYSKTLESYKRFFGQFPPVEIWPEPKVRFGRDLKFVRVNTEQNWVVPKPPLSLLLKVISSLFRGSKGGSLTLGWKNSIKPNPTIMFSLLFSLAFIVTGCEAFAGFPNPLNFTGPQFLAFYIFLSIIVISMASRLRSFLCLPDGDPRQQPVSLNTYETAYLVGSERRVVDTVIASFVQRGLVTVQPEERKLTFNGSATQLSDPLEQAVADGIKLQENINGVHRQSAQATSVIGERLQQIGLLVNQAQSFKAQLYPALLIAALLALGIAKIVVGISRDKPVGFLFMLCFAIFGVGLGFWLIPTHRSRYGERVLQDLRSRIPSTVASPTNFQLPLAFALWGMTVLPNDLFADWKQVFTPESGGGGGDGGGGGCGGGGCGGCGGCGGG